MFRRILAALRDWTVRHVLRPKHERIGDYLVIDDLLIDAPLEQKR
jgi:hypothetical protein